MCGGDNRYMQNILVEILKMRQLKYIFIDGRIIKVRMQSCLCVLSEHQAIICGNGGIAPCILDLGTSWR
jgi:hypothetical protein